MSVVASTVPRQAPGPGAPSAARLFWTELKYQQVIYWRNPVSAFFTFFMPVMFLVIFGSIDSGGHVPGGNLALDQYFVPSIVSFGLLAACYTNIAVQLATQRELGILKRVRSSPLPGSVYLTTVVLSSILRAFLLTGITLGFGAAFYHVKFPAHSALALVVVVVVGAMAFSALGIAVTAIIPNSDAAPAVVNGIYLPLVFISGTFYPISSSSVLSKIAVWFPVRPFILACFNAMNPEVAGTGIQWNHVIDVAIWGAAGLIVALRTFRWVPSRRD